VDLHLQSLWRDFSVTIDWSLPLDPCPSSSSSHQTPSGDIPYKGFTPGEVVNEPFAWPDSHNQVPSSSPSCSLTVPQIFSADLVIPNPEFVSYDLIPEDEFMILASDGLWDVVKSQEACSRVRSVILSCPSVSLCLSLSLCLTMAIGSHWNLGRLLKRFLRN
jgi:hypothetical protein